MDHVFLISSILMGVGLAMDAFSVSVANGLSEPWMKRKKMVFIAGTYAFFQALMPLAGWLCVHTLLEYFSSLQKFIPWIALILLVYIGGKMILEGIRDSKEGGGGKEGENHEDRTETLEERNSLGLSQLMLQGVATSIDALSVGFVIADYGAFKAVCAALLIAVVTFFICMFGLMAGKKLGSHFSGHASVTGGVILVLIGVEIFVSGVFL